MHYYNVTPIAEEINYIQNHFEEISKLIPILVEYGFQHLTHFKQTIELQLQAVHRKFETICHNHRNKRALINALGTIIKTISGNLDNEDAERYNKAIINLQNNQKNIIKKVNQHISLNKILIDNLRNATLLIKYNQDILAKEINSLKHELKQYIYETTQYLRMRAIMDQLSLSLQIILHFITDLENAVTFAKVNALHNSILKADEMKFITKTLLSIHAKEQLLYINEEDFINYYDIISVDAYYSNELIVFILHFPILYPQNFTQFHLYSIPTSNFTTIIPPSPYLIMSTALYQYSDVPCRKIKNEYLCPINTIRLNNEFQDCITEIFRLTDRVARCQYIPVTVNSTIIQELTKSSYVGIFPNPTKIHLQCATSSIADLHGVYLIELPSGCSFKTPNENFVNSDDSSNEKPLLLPKIKTMQINLDEKRKPIKLQKVPLDELYKVQQEEELQSLINDELIDYTHLWTTPLYIVATIAVVFGCYYFISVLKKSKEEDITKVLFVPHKTSSGDGEVTMPH